jgi:hypothetical protein
VPAQPETIPLPLASYQLADLRAGSKRLIGCYPEPAPQAQTDDMKDQQPACLRRWPGITQFTPSGLINPLRGIWEMAGTVYAVVGFDLFTVSSAGIFTLVPGSASGIIGTGFVRMTDNGACLAILVPGTDVCYTYTPFSGGGGMQQLTSSFFLTLGGAIDCWFVDSYIVFLANNNAATARTRSSTTTVGRCRATARSPSPPRRRSTGSSAPIRSMRCA